MSKEAPKLFQILERPREGALEDAVHAIDVRNVELIRNGEKINHSGIYRLLEDLQPRRPDPPVEGPLCFSDYADRFGFPTARKAWLRNCNWFPPMIDTWCQNNQKSNGERPMTSDQATSKFLYQVWLRGLDKSRSGPVYIFMEAVKVVKKKEIKDILKIKERYRSDRERKKEWTLPSGGRDKDREEKVITAALQYDVDMGRCPPFHVQIEEMLFYEISYNATESRWEHYIETLTVSDDILERVLDQDSSVIIEKRLHAINETCGPANPPIGYSWMRVEDGAQAGIYASLWRFSNFNVRLRSLQPVNANRITLGEQAAISNMQLGEACHLVFLVDSSKSMGQRDVKVGERYVRRIDAVLMLLGDFLQNDPGRGLDHYSAVFFSDAGANVLCKKASASELRNRLQSYDAHAKHGASYVRAIECIRALTDLVSRTRIIFLSDSRPGDAQQYIHYFNDYMNWLGKNHDMLLMDTLQVYTIGMHSEKDFALLHQMANLGNGLYFTCASNMLALRSAFSTVSKTITQRRATFTGNQGVAVKEHKRRQDRRERSEAYELPGQFLFPDKKAMKMHGTSEVFTFNGQSFSASTKPTSIEVRCLPFERGAMRQVHMMRDKSEPDVKWVCKVGRWLADGYDLQAARRDAQSLAIAAYFAEKFCEACDLPVTKITFLRCYVYRCDTFDKWGDSKSHILVGEPYLEHRFIKYNGNEGFVNDVDECLEAQAFLHFTHEMSNKQLMIADIQGIHGPDGNYVFTDPQILSLPGLYGPGDLGALGMRKCMTTHTCNYFCARWKKKLQPGGVGLNEAGRAILDCGFKFTQASIDWDSNEHEMPDLVGGDVASTLSPRSDVESSGRSPSLDELLRRQSKAPRAKMKVKSRAKKRSTKTTRDERGASVSDQSSKLKAITTAQDVSDHHEVDICNNEDHRPGLDAQLSGAENSAMLSARADSSSCQLLECMTCDPIPAAANMTEYSTDRHERALGKHENHRPDLHLQLSGKENAAMPSACADSSSCQLLECMACNPIPAEETHDDSIGSSYSFWNSESRDAIAALDASPPETGSACSSDRGSMAAHFEDIDVLSSCGMRQVSEQDVLTPDGGTYPEADQLDFSGFDISTEQGNHSQLPLTSDQSRLSSFDLFSQASARLDAAEGEDLRSPSEPGAVVEALPNLPAVEVHDEDSARIILIVCGGVDEDNIEIESIPNGVKVCILLCHDNGHGGIFEREFQYDYKCEGVFELREDECCYDDGVLRLVLKKMPKRRMKLRSSKDAHGMLAFKEVDEQRLDRFSVPAFALTPPRTDDSWSETSESSWYKVASFGYNLSCCSQPELVSHAASCSNLSDSNACSAPPSLPPGQCLLPGALLLDANGDLAAIGELKKGSPLQCLQDEGGELVYRTDYVKAVRPFPNCERDLCEIRILPSWTDKADAVSLCVTSNHYVLSKHEHQQTLQALMAKELHPAKHMLLVVASGCDGLEQHEGKIETTSQVTISREVLALEMENPSSAVLLAIDGSNPTAPNGLFVAIFSSPPMPKMAAVVDRKGFIRVDIVDDDAASSGGAQGRKCPSDPTHVADVGPLRVYRTIRRPHSPSCHAQCRFHFAGVCRSGILCPRCHHEDHRGERVYRDRRRNKG